MAYTIVFNSNGGDDTARITISQTANNGEPFDLMKRPGFIYRQGFTFVGWGSTTFATEAVYHDEEHITEDLAPSGASITLYAVWRKNLLVDFLSGMAMEISSKKPMASQGTVPTQTLMDCLNTLGWTVDDASLVYDAGTFLGKAGSQSYYKYSDGFAICIFSIRETYKGPSLISNVADNAAYKQGINGGKINPNKSFTINGETWYLNTQNHQSSYPSDNTTFATFTMHESTLQEDLENTIFPALSWRFKPFHDSRNFVKGIEAGRALCKMI